jgi:prolyl-tRNA editing enzyme YbaK/EbsC (Cys-tRNA(Pro) deacylase)
VREQLATSDDVDDLPVYALAHPVVTCGEAASAKGVDLSRELKSLVLETSSGLAVAHIRGDAKLLLRAVKRELNVPEARLASTAALQTVGVSPGTVTPFAPMFHNLSHLVARSVLELDWVTTNSGTLTGYVVFRPTRLLNRLRYVTVAPVSNRCAPQPVLERSS